MLKSQKGIIFLTALVLFALYFFIRPSFQMDGNNEKNIVKAIQSFDGYENKDAIEILKIFDSIITELLHSYITIILDIFISIKINTETINGHILKVKMMILLRCFLLN